MFVCIQIHWCSFVFAILWLFCVFLVIKTVCDFICGLIVFVQYWATMGTTGRFGGGGHGLTGPKHIWYDTDYSELYKGLAVVIGFFLFLVLLLLIFILISYLRKWYRLKKRPDSANVDDVVTVGHKGEHRRPIDPTMAKCQMGGQAPGKRYSKSGVPSASGSQQSTPLIKSLPKSSLTSIPVEIIDGKMMKSIHNQHLQQQGYPAQMPLSNQPPITSASQQQQNAHYQEFPTHVGGQYQAAHYPIHMHSHSNNPNHQQHQQIVDHQMHHQPHATTVASTLQTSSNSSSSSSNTRQCRPSLATIALT